MNHVVERLINFSRWFHLRDRMIALFLVSSLLPVICVSLVIYVQSSATIFNNLSQSVEDANTRTTSYISDKLLKVVSDSVEISRSRIVYQLLTKAEGYTSLRLHILQSFQREMNRNFIYNDLVTEILLYTPDKVRTTLYAPYTYRFRPTAEEFDVIVNACESDTHKSHLLSLNNSNTMILCRAITREEKIIGYVVLRIDQIRISEIFYHKGASQASLSLLLNGDGRVVISNNNTLLDTQLDDGEMIRRITAGEKGFTFTLNGTPRIVHASPILGTGLYYLTLTEKSLFSADTNQLGLILIIAVLSGIVLATIVSFLMACSILAPSERIIRSIQAYKDENTSIEIHDQGRDELAIMSRAFNEMSARLNQTIANIRSHEKQKRLLEIQALQQQINPHFIANTLNMIANIAFDRGQIDIQRLCNSVNNMLHNSIRFEEHWVSIRQEFNLLDSYLEIQEYRLLGKFTITREVNPELEHFLIPHMVLLPIVENAVIHGLQPDKHKRGLLMIKGDLNEDSILFTVTDNGVGMSSEKVSQVLHGGEVKREKSRYNNIGLSNVHERIRLLYGERYGLVITSAENVFTTVTIRLPIHNDERDTYVSNNAG